MIPSPAYNYAPFLMKERCFHCVPCADHCSAHWRGQRLRDVLAKYRGKPISAIQVSSSSAQPLLFLWSELRKGAVDDD